VVAAVTAAVVLGVLGLVPVRAQTLTLEAPRAAGPVPLDDPWSSTWDTVPKLRIPLSAQNIAPPYGGGAIRSVTARAQHDAERVYFLLEWTDLAPDASVTANLEFTDAAALQFPITDDATPYTMGGPDHPVNIWQWKAVWQSDIESGFETSAERWPDAVVDVYPHPDDPLYRPAESLGNLNAQRDRITPIEDLVAEGFGTLTTAETQQVLGAGEWRDNRWRVVFSRSLSPGESQLASFGAGRTTPVAFAVWDGRAGDRNGQKSIAQFIDVRLVEEATAPETPTEVPESRNQLRILVLALAGLIVSAALLSIGTRARDEPTE
jgi:hypothetical protein